MLAAPIDKLCNLYRNIVSCEDLPQLTLSQIAHFFEQYNDLEEGKWVKIEGWESANKAKSEIIDGIERFNAAKEKPVF